MRDHALVFWVKVVGLALAAAPFVARGMSKQEAFERAVELFDAAEAYVRGSGEREP